MISMRHLVLSILVIMTLPAYAQKSKVLAVMQMIDAAKFDEAKEAIELAVENPRTSDWARTFYTKGLLCQTAYEKGVEKKDPKLTTMYGDQLYVAYDAYAKALELDSRERLHSAIRHNYYLLDNDFRKLGAKHYAQKEYKEALRAFEHAIFIGESELISARADTNLIYNAAMAAYECQNWEKAAKYLTLLHEAAYSPATSLLLSISLMNSGDTIHSEKIMMHSLEQYQYRDTLVMYVVNFQVREGNTDLAIEVLDKSIEARPENYRFLWARGLVYEEMNRYDDAIQSFLQATELSEDNPELYYHLGVGYYNIGIELRESALNITENAAYRKAREKYQEKFREAVRWLERSYELDPENQNTVTRLHQLYRQLQMTEKQKNLEQQGGS